MSSIRKIAIITGILYLTANIAGPIGFGFELPILDAPEYLANIAANETKWLLGMLFELVMAVAIMGIGVTLYPVLKKHNESLGISYVSSRIIECVILIFSVVSALTLLSVSHEYTAAGAAAPAYFQTLGTLLQEARDWSGHVVLDVAVFPLGALILYGVLYKTKLVPRWLSGSGLVGAVMYWSAGILVMFSLITPLTTPHIILQAPLGIQELIFGLWLILKGFNPTAIASEAAAEA